MVAHYLWLRGVDEIASPFTDVLGLFRVSSSHVHASGLLVAEGGTADATFGTLLPVPEAMSQPQMIVQVHLLEHVATPLASWVALCPSADLTTVALTLRLAPMLALGVAPGVPVGLEVQAAGFRA